MIITAVKVKEPKFKVGDVVYWINIEEDNGFNCYKIEISSLEEDRYSYNYNAKYLFDDIPESELFTLEEAIEKLKEL